MASLYKPILKTKTPLTKSAAKKPNGHKKPLSQN